MGPVWATLQLEDAKVARQLRPDMTRVAALHSEGVADVTVFGLELEGAGVGRGALARAGRRDA